MGIFENIFNKIDAALITTVASKAGTIISAVSPLMAILFGIYVLLVAFSYMINESPLWVSAGDFVKRTIGWLVIIGFSMNASNYMSTVVPFFNGLPDDLAGAIIGTSSGFTTLDAVADQFLNAISDIITEANNTSITDIGAKFAAYLMIGLLALFALGFVAFASAYIILSKVFLAVLLVLGPMFLILAIFPVTRQYAGAWISAVVSQTMTIALLLIVGNVCASVLQTAAGAAGAGGGTGLDIQTCLILCLIGFSFILLVLQVPNVAASLSSGGIGLGGSIISAARSGSMASGVARNLGARKAAGDASSGASATGRAAKNAYGRLRGGNSAKPT